MGNVVLPATLAAQLRDKLIEQDQVVKTANEQRHGALEKLAVVRLENNVLREVLQLVADGFYEPDEALQKVAEFLEKPRDLEVVKAAHEMGLDRIPALGTPVSEPDSALVSGGNVIFEKLLEMQEQGLIG